MAGKSNTIELIIKASSRTAVKEIRTLQSSFQDLGSSLSSIKSTVFSLRGALAGLGAGLVVRDVIKTYANFDDVMRQTGAVTNATASEFLNLRAAAKAMGAATRYTATQAGEGLLFLGKAGFSAQKAISSLPSVLQLASAGSLDLGQAADITTNIMTAFGQTVNDLSNTNDILVSAFTGSNSSLQELGEGFKYVGPIAKGLGVSFVDLIGALGKLHDGGIKASMAGTTLRGVLDALFNPTKQEADLLAELSQRIQAVTGNALKIKESTGKFVGFVSILKQLETAGLKADEALTLFGLRAGPGMAALMLQGSESLQRFENRLGSAGGTSARIAEQMEAGLGGAIRRLYSALESLKIEALDEQDSPLIEVFEDLTKAVLASKDSIKEWSRNALVWFRELFVETKKYIKDHIGDLKNMATTLGNTAVAIGEFVYKWREMIVLLAEAYVVVSVTMWLVNLGVAIKGIIAAIAGLSIVAPILAGIKLALEGIVIAAGSAGAAFAILTIIVISLYKVAQALVEAWKAWQAIQANEKTADKLKKEADAVKQYANTVVKSADEVSKLSPDKLKEYVEQLAGAQKYWGKTSAAMEALGQDTKYADDRFKDYNTAVKHASLTLQLLEKQAIKTKQEMKWDPLKSWGEKEANLKLLASGQDPAALRIAVTDAIKYINEFQVKYKNSSDDVAKAWKKSFGDLRSWSKDTFASLSSDAQKFIVDIATIQGMIEISAKSTKDLIREAERSAMSPEKAYKDKIKEIKEGIEALNTEAAKLTPESSTEELEKLRKEFEKLKKEAAGLTGEVRTSEGVVIKTAQQATKTAVSLIEEIGLAQSNLLKHQQDVKKETMQGAMGMAEAFKPMEDNFKALEQIDLQKEVKLVPIDNELQEKIKQLQDLKIEVDVIFKKKNEPATTTNTTEGLEGVVGMAGGGRTPGRSPHDRADNILARLTAGEWVIQKPSVRYYGDGIISAINRRLINKKALLSAAAGSIKSKVSEAIPSAISTVSRTLSPPASLPGYAVGGAVSDLSRALPDYAYYRYLNDLEQLSIYNDRIAAKAADSARAQELAAQRWGGIMSQMSAFGFGGGLGLGGSGTMNIKISGMTDTDFEKTLTRILKKAQARR